jgi:uncharacterized phiE125 gp8 family phage protein
MSKYADRYRYALRLIEPPSEDVISLEQARRNSSVDGDDHDEMLVELIQQARNYCEEQTDVCLLTATWEMTFDKFPCGSKPIELPRWPAQSIESVLYTDGAGDEQSIELDQLRLRIDDLGRGRLARAAWATWPITLDTPDAVKIQFKAGWLTPEAVPAVWTRAQLMLVSWWFEQREAGVYGQAARAPIGVDDLLANAAAIDDFEDFDLG